MVYSHKELDKNTFANIRANLTGRVATLNLTPEWDDHKITTVKLKRSAFHEVCELLIARLGYIAEARFITSEETEEEGHAIIRRLENAFFEDAS